MIPSPIKQHITFLYTRDLEATAHFYGEVLGLDVWLDQGDCLIYRVCQEGYIGFCRRASAPSQPRGVILCLVTEDVDGWAGYLQARGISLTKPPQLNPDYHIYHFFATDPNGYLVEFQRFLSER
ncbi:MAG: VOC family protein [Chloroflexi bacterium]|nr:MAG: VOC family protein [Chloroflexota bacterium]